MSDIFRHFLIAAHVDKHIVTIVCVIHDDNGSQGNFKKVNQYRLSGVHLGTLDVMVLCCFNLWPACSMQVEGGLKAG
jgi:hypothetical protein